jgi:hypothetical protein
MFVNGSVFQLHVFKCMYVSAACIYNIMHK